MEELDKVALLTTCYFAPIQYYSKVNAYSAIVIEKHENYQKQTYRNRCQILSANGVMALSVPVIKQNGNHTQIQDILVDYSTPWQRVHFKAIESAYRTAAYYEHYIEEIIPLFEKKEKFLLDLNHKAHIAVMSILGLNKPTTFTSAFDLVTPNDIDDYRNTIHPKQQKQQDDPCYEETKYFQVFSDRFPYTPNLSIIDLFMNLGSDSIRVLNESYIPKK